MKKLKGHFGDLIITIIGVVISLYTYEKIREAEKKDFLIQKLEVLEEALVSKKFDILSKRTVINVDTTQSFSMKYYFSYDVFYEQIIEFEYYNDRKLMDLQRRLNYFKERHKIITERLPIISDTTQNQIEKEFTEIKNNELEIIRLYKNYFMDDINTDEIENKLKEPIQI